MRAVAILTQASWMHRKPDFPSLRGNKHFEALWRSQGKASLCALASRGSERYSSFLHLQAMAEDELWEERHNMVRKHLSRNQFDALPDRHGQGSQACCFFVAAIIIQ